MSTLRTIGIDRPFRLRGAKSGVDLPANWAQRLPAANAEELLGSSRRFCDLTENYVLRIYGASAPHRIVKADL